MSTRRALLVGQSTPLPLPTGHGIPVGRSFSRDQGQGRDQ